MTQLLNFMKPLGGRMFRGRIAMLVLALCISAQSAVAQRTLLDPHNLPTSIPSNKDYGYKTDQITREDHVIDGRRAGVKSDFSRVKWGIDVLNHKLSWEKPYVEIKFAFYMNPDLFSFSHATYDNALFVKYEDDYNWHMVAHSQRESYDWVNKDVDLQGYVVCQKPDDDYHTTMRWYPRYIDLYEGGRKVEKVRFVQGWNMKNDDKGKYQVTYGDQILDVVAVYDFPISYNFGSDLQKIGTFKENPQGKVEFSVSGLPTPKNSLVSSNNADTWKKNKRKPLTDTYTDWYGGSNSKVRCMDEDNRVVIADTKMEFTTTSNSTASAKASLTSTSYNTPRRYWAEIQIDRTFHTGTNSFHTNYEYDILQSVVFQSYGDWLEPMPRPSNLRFTPKMWEKHIELNWDAPADASAYKDGKWHIFRDGKHIASVDYGKTAYTDSDAGLEYDSVYTYKVSFGHKDWGSTISEPEPNLSCSNSTKLTRNFFLSLGIDPLNNGFRLKWEHPAIQSKTAPTFKILRRKTGESFQTIGSGVTANSDSTSHSYTDTDIEGVTGLTYEYKVSIEVMDMTFETETQLVTVETGSKVLNASASKGDFPGSVRVQWEAMHVGDGEAQYAIYRRLLGSGKDFVKIHTMRGKSTSYSYEDNTVYPGQFYEYKVESQVQDINKDYRPYTSFISDGFCQSAGVLSGRITYGTGTAVEGVRVNIAKSNEDENTKSQFYAMRMSSVGAGIEYAFSDEQNEKIFGAPFTAQMWVSLDKELKEEWESESCQPQLLSSNDFRVYAVYDETNHAYKLWFSIYKDGTWENNFETDLTLNPTEYYHLTLGLDQKSGVTLRLIGEDKALHQWSKVDVGYAPLTNVERRLAFGHSDNSTQTFTGYIDEIRLWDKLLTDIELQKNYDRLLSGTEKGLCLYSPLDEGVENQPTAYDYSSTDGMPNNVHGEIYPGTTCSDHIPGAEQLSLYGLTDAQGNYVIRGVPFAGKGTNYQIIPSMGVHEFSPQYATRFVGANSLNHSGIDIEDVSSFPVSGTVYYEGTLYPVEGAQLYIDGNLASRDGKAITTDAQGAFRVSVPIGDHFIEVRKNGHTFVNAGRYPADEEEVGTRHTFDRAISGLSFYDNTKVVVAGRVAGGEIEIRKPLGMALSTNNIGQAKITLSTGYKMNVVTTVSGTTSSVDSNPNDVVETSGNADVNSSTTYRGGDYAEFIEIQTDPTTGEFVAMLPPVAYKVESVKVPSNEAVTFGTFANIDATNPTVTRTDSTQFDGGEKKTFKYHTSFVAAYRVAPTFTVSDAGNTVGAFGEKTYSVVDAQGDTTKINLYTVGDDGSVTYTYGHPIFLQLNSYRLKLKGYEEYVNKDDPANPVTSFVPLSGTVVIITNQLSTSQEVHIDPESVYYGQQPTDLKSNELALDSLGEATYIFSAGFPNILDDFTRGLNISYQNNGHVVNWSGSDTFKGIILGALPSGNNFVTAGPDEILMVLRDPPGSGSSTTWEEGTTTSKSSTYGKLFDSTTENEETIMAGLQQQIVTGIGLAKITDIKHNADVHLGTKWIRTTKSSNESVISLTASQAISTSSSSSYVGHVGDLFIGNSTNIIFGKARSVGLYKNTDGTEGYSISQKEVMSVGSEFKTMFCYTENFVDGTLIDNLKRLRNAMIISVSEAEYDSYVNNSDRMMYISKISPDDPRFGSMNGDAEVWGSAATSNIRFEKGLPIEGPSYKILLPKSLHEDSICTDSVLWYNQQIKLWRQALADNEKAKVDAIEHRDQYLEKNYSFDGGFSIRNSVEKTNTFTKSSERTFEVLGIGGVETGFAVDGFGVKIDTKTETGGGSHDASVNEETKTVKMEYELSANGGNSITVDVYNAPDGFGPVFVTRGGQTCDPYEDKVVTQYYKPGTVISYATMQVEMPEITVTNAVAADVPAGGDAIFELKLANLSEVDWDIYYDLCVNDESNPHGAAISIDGDPLTDSRAVLVPAGRTITKTLVLRQTDESVLDYEDIQIVLKSQSQGDPTAIFPCISDTVAISAYFVPSCSEISIDIQNKTLNMFTGDQLAIKVGDFNRGYKSFKGLRIQYKYASDESWTTAQEYVINEEDLTSSNALLPEGSPISYTLDMSNAGLFPDGEYTFRALTMCDFGLGEVNNMTPEITVVKDMARPQILGSANPADGILNAEDDIFVTFNEDIRSGALSSADNFIVTGALNGASLDHATALLLTGTEEPAAKTEAAIKLAGRSFAADWWMKVDAGEGSLFEHGAGDNKFSVGLNASGNLVVGIGSASYTSTSAVPTGKWVFLSMVYDYSTGASTFSAQVASDAETISLFKNAEVADYSGHGPLAVGRKLNGAMHELTLWNISRSLSESQAEMHSSKTASTPGIIGYWKMDEGKGSKLADKARNRHMTSAAGWAFNNENFAAGFDGSSRMALDISAVSVRPTDNYALELWFRGEAQTNATIFSLSNETLALRSNASGQLAFVTKGTETPLAGNWLDGQWHHFALNVLRSGVAVVYLDGTATKQFASADVPSMQGDALHLGTQLTTTEDADGATIYTYAQYFKGDIDEVRFWNATLNATILAERSIQRMDTAQAEGLVAYYPFETRSLDSYGQVVCNFSTADQSTSKATALATEAINVTQAATAPGLKEAPAATNLQFSFTASDRQVFISLLDAADRLEGATVNFTLRNVRDMNNNIMSPVTWSAYVSRNRLKWAEGEASLECLAGDEDCTFTAVVSNSGSSTEQWTLVNLPSWLTASEEQGAVRPQASREITFRVAEHTAIGSYEETIYLTGNDGIYEPLVVSLKVKGEAPNWSVNPADFDQSMNFIGQLQVDGITSTDGDDLLAAFIGEQCVGIGSPVYFARYDAYFVMLNVYSNSGESNKNVSFKMWDAGTGDIYPSVSVATPVVFEANSVIGDFDAPFVWNAKEQREQKVELTKGWNWMSLYVNPEDRSLNTLFGNVADKFELVKGNESFSQSADGSFTGSLTEMNIGSLYMVKTNANVETGVYGAAVNPANHQLTLAGGWNWIGYNVAAMTSLDDAFADAAPQEGDVVKGQNSFAVYKGYEWVGSLTYLEPGAGYMYKSLADGEKTFTYPNAGTSTRATKKIRTAVRSLEPQYFEQVSPHLYPFNMSVVAVVQQNGEILKDVEVGVFSGSECREAIHSNEEGMLFLSIHGEGSGEKLTFKVLVEGEVKEVDQNLRYEDNAIIGSTKACYVIDLDKATTGIATIVTEAMDNVEVYTLSGVFISRTTRGLAPGIYIINGQKALVK